MPFTQQVPAKRTNMSSKPLKSFNWQKMTPIAAKDTIWKGIDDEPVHKALKDEYSFFEDLFAAKETKAREKAPSTDNLGI
jgi:hypothetical protein